MNTITNNEPLATGALENLKAVYDPELGINVVDLGLIYQLDIDEMTQKVFTEMTLTTQFCPMGDAITSGVRQCLETTFPGFEIDLHLSFEPPWNPGMISEEGRQQMER